VNSEQPIPKNIRLILSTENMK